MADESTILLSKDTIELLKRAKETPRQTYNELLTKAITLYIKSKQDKSSNYDKFLHEIQKKKMKELWDNEYDEAWEKI
jgi:hypothetical protein